MTATEGDSPGDPFEGERGAAWLSRATWGFVALGVLLRVSRFALNYPLWGDEAFVAVNFLRRGYLDLLRPLDYGQVCPFLFLWIERALVTLFGFSERSLRLFPMLCGIASVVLFRHAAGIVIRGVPLLLAVAIFAVSSHPIRHAAEVKPYATDLLVALGFLALAFGWRAETVRTWRLWVLSAFAPMALGLSHPAVFVAGGVSLGLLGAVWRTGRRDARIAFAVFNLAVAGTFLILFTAQTRSQGLGPLNGLRDYWAASFPPRDGPWAVARWLVRTHTGPLFEYPRGGREGASAPTFALCVAAAVVLWRSGQRTVLAVCLAPFGLTLAAAVVHRYPYGGEARVVQFLAPSVCLLTGLGSAALLARIARPGPRAAATLAVSGALAALGIVSLCASAASPYRMEYDHQAREFARGFWPALAAGGEVACFRWDFGIIDANSLNLKSALYVCNQQIYRPRGRGKAGPRWENVSASRPLRCVLAHETPLDAPETRVWLDLLGERFDLCGRKMIAVNMAPTRARPRLERVTVLEFVPRADRPPPRLAGRRAPGPALR